MTESVYSKSHPNQHTTKKWLAQTTFRHRHTSTMTDKCRFKLAAVSHKSELDTLLLESTQISSLEQEYASVFHQQRSLQRPGYHRLGCRRCRSWRRHRAPCPCCRVVAHVAVVPLRSHQTSAARPEPALHSAQLLTRQTRHKYTIKDQSSLVKGRIAVATHPPNSSFVLARWQHRTDDLAAICNCMFWVGFNPQSPLPLGGGRNPHLTQYVI